jgi:hypothetical protein
MRGFQCYYYRMRDNNKLIAEGNRSCWAGINNECYFYDKIQKERIVFKLLPENKDDIFIDQFKVTCGTVSEKDIKRVVHLINKITPCKLVKIKKKQYIKYRKVGYYYSDLLLLNIIRMLWYQPKRFNMEEYYKSIHDRFKGDPLIFLMERIKNQVDESATAGYSYGDHSCIYKNIVPKTKQQLLDYKKGSMENFIKQYIN